MGAVNARRVRVKMYYRYSQVIKVVIRDKSGRPIPPGSYDYAMFYICKGDKKTLCEKMEVDAYGVRLNYESHFDVDDCGSAYLVAELKIGKKEYVLKEFAFLLVSARYAHNLKRKLLEIDLKDPNR